MNSRARDGRIGAVASARLGRRGALLGATALATAGALGGGRLRAQEKVSLRVSWWGSDDRHQRTLKLLKLWESRHPGTTVTGEYGGLIGYQDKIATEFAGGNAPDVMQLTDVRRALAAAGRILQLDEYVASGELDLSDANQAVLTTAKMGGKLYNVPWGLASGCYFLDTRVFADTSTDLPGLDWNWDQYAAIATKISKAAPKGLYGSADIWAPAGTSALYPFEFFLRARGKTLFNTDGKLNFGAAELTEWFTFWDEMRRSGAVPPGEVSALENGYESSPLVTGHAAMYPINSSIATSLQGLTQHKLVVRPLPSGLGSKALGGPQYGAFVNSSMQVGINAASKYRKQAVDFVNALINDPEFAKIQQMSRGVPLSAKMAALVTPDITPVEQSMVETVQYVAAHSTSLFVAWPPVAAQVQDLMQRVHQQLAFAQLTPAQTAKRFLDEAEDLMD